MTNFIVLFIIITVILLCAISCIVEYMKEKKQQIEYNEQLNSVVPGTLLVRRRYQTSNNPFAPEPSGESSIKILEVKKNTSGEIWIKYAYEDLWNNNSYLEKIPSYDKLEDKLYTYPNIVLPE